MSETMQEYSNPYTAIGTAYVNLSNWNNESPDWEGAGEFEVYPNQSTDAEMEFWFYPPEPFAFSR
jgi:hypothetical protein